MNMNGTVDSIEVMAATHDAHESAPSSVTENTELCWKCKALLNSQYPDHVIYKENDEMITDRGRTLSRTLKTSQSIEATQEGCPLCQIIMHTMGDSMRDSLHRFRQEDLVYEHALHLNVGRPGYLSVIVTSDNIAEELGDDEIKCFIDLFPVSELADYLNYGVVEPSTDSNPTWCIVSDWLVQCNNTHESCAAATKDPKQLPSRVIDVSPGQPPRLLIVSKSIKPARYTTLSHCWGSHMPLQLLSSNIAALQKEIPFSHLTKTFQDAITTSRRLGIQYLWIDSLCIIQDSLQDWQEQSATMAQVYSNSYCNIAAAHAQDGKFGCFTSRNPAFVKPLRLDLNWGLNPGSYYAVQSRYWRSNVSEAPLNMRGWVYQERTLAPRNLFFGTTEVFFECSKVAASEQFPAQLPPSIGAVGFRSIQPQIAGPYIRKSQGLEADHSLGAFSLWGQLVENFSLGHLTYTTDKLVALSAIASEMQGHIKSEYLAGMCRQHLAYQLLWEVRGVQWLVQRRRPKEYIAPTWSWASVVGQVENACDVRFANDQEIILEVLDWEVELINAANLFGQVKSGFLRIRGSLAKGSVLSYKSRSGGEHLQLSVNNGAPSTVIFDNGEEGAEVVGQEFYFLSIRYLPRYEQVVRNGVSMGVPQISGIILRQLCPSKGEYVRVGKFEDFGNPKEFQSGCRQLAAEVGDWEQETGGWGPRHALTIL